MKAITGKNEQKIDFQPKRSYNFHRNQILGEIPVERGLLWKK